MAIDVDTADKLSVTAESDDSYEAAEHGDETDPLNSDIDAVGDGEIAISPDSGARPPRVWMAVAIALATTVAAGIVGGVLGLNAYRWHQHERLHAEFLRVGRQGAQDLTTISYTDVDGAVRRILDGSTGAFHDDFQQRSGPFVDVVKQTQSSTEGTITAAALESAHDDQAQVLIAVSVRTTGPVAPLPQPHLWRMRITVEKVGDGAKISNVAFVE